jgi:hypothetical protein
MPPASEWDTSDEQLELRLRQFAIPAALAVAWLLVKSGVGHFVLRTFCSMWVHELGHAVAAWLCGYPAFPGPWLTLTAESRSPLLAFLLFAALAWGTFRAWQRERRGLVTVFGALTLVQLFCTLALSTPRAQQLILFAGDGGALVLGTLLMLTLYAPEGSALKKDWLRWGFLVIGAASFADVFEQWWSSRHDPDRIPFGMNEGVGLSDPSRLSDQFGWSADQLISRYVVLGCLCLMVLACAYFFGLRPAPPSGATSPLRPDRE